jgi:hypothetical protein
MQPDNDVLPVRGISKMQLPDALPDARPPMYIAQQCIRLIRASTTWSKQHHGQEGPSQTFAGCLANIHLQAQHLHQSMQAKM